MECGRFSSPGVVVSELIMAHGRTPIHVCNSGFLTSQRYRDDVLESYVTFFSGALWMWFLFIDDIDSLHRATLVDEFVESVDTEQLPWPAKSVNLNLKEDGLTKTVARRYPPLRSVNALESVDTEQLPWAAKSVNLNLKEDGFRKTVAQRYPPLRNVYALKTALLEKWNFIPQIVLNNVIANMKTVCDIHVFKSEEITYQSKFISINFSELFYLFIYLFIHF